ncbi:MAG: hypothetical protein EXR68_06260 [Dehalococcoidia bacterium]|nr:hypothetical protein [Dehalococcoidia bacterium]
MASGILLFAEGNAWRVVFVGAHLLALLALIPLGVVLALRAYQQEGGMIAMVSRYPFISGLLLCLAVTVTLAILNFEADHEVRRAANFGSLAIIIVLVVRYLRWSRALRS